MHGEVDLPEDLTRAEGQLPKTVLSARSMMSQEERALLYSFAAGRYAGVGKIVDAGVFLGASTVCFGQGIRDSGRAIAIAKPIALYDLAKVSSGMIGFFAKKKIYGHLRFGDDLRDVIRHNTREFEPLVDYRFGDFTVAEWTDDEDIEILFLDVLKTPKLNRHVVAAFYPRLIPGVSYVVQQDYFYHRLPYIKIYQEYFFDYFEYVGRCKSSAVFRLKSAIPDELLRLDLFAATSVDELLRLHGRAEARCEGCPRRAYMTSLSAVELLAEVAGPQEALDELRRIKARHERLIAEDETKYLAKLARELRSVAAPAGKEAASVP